MSIALSLDEVRPILRRLYLADAIAVESVEGGSSPIFRLDLADDSSVILKTYPDSQGKQPRREAYASSLASRLGLPVTRYFAVDESCASLPFRFAITNYLSGVPANSLRDHPRIGDIYRQMGSLLRRLHTVALPTYGHIGEHGILDPVDNNIDYMGCVIAHAFARFEQYGGDPTLARRLRKIVDGRFRDVVRHSRGPAFAHDDLHPGNVLVRERRDGALEVTGLLDFGNARAADPVFDLAKCLFICAHDAPGSRAAILAGYGAIDHPDPEEALRYYTLVHQVVMWWWLRHVGVIASPDAPNGLIDDLRMAVQA